MRAHPWSAPAWAEEYHGVDAKRAAVAGAVLVRFGFAAEVADTAQVGDPAVEGVADGGGKQVFPGLRGAPRPARGQRRQRALGGERCERGRPRGRPCREAAAAERSRASSSWKRMRFVPCDPRSENLWLTCAPSRIRTLRPTA